MYRNIDLERELGLAIERVLNNGVTPDDLYELYRIGQQTESKIVATDPEGFDDELAYLSLKNAIDFTYQLHDRDTREYLHSRTEELRKKLQHYTDILLGREEPKYHLEPQPGVSVDVTYKNPVKN